MVPAAVVVEVEGDGVGWEAGLDGGDGCVAHRGVVDDGALGHDGFSGGLMWWGFCLFCRGAAPRRSSRIALDGVRGV